MSVDPGKLPQTSSLPSDRTPSFRAHIATLWRGIVTGSVAVAMPAFFPRAAQVLLMVVVPVGVATTVPVRALTGAVDVAWLPAGIGGLAVALVLTRLHWNAALRKYSSASS